MAEDGRHAVINSVCVARGLARRASAFAARPRPSASRPCSRSGPGHGAGRSYPGHPAVHPATPSSRTASCRLHPAPPHREPVCRRPGGDMTALSRSLRGSGVRWYVPPGQERAATVHGRGGHHCHRSSSAAAPTRRRGIILHDLTCTEGRRRSRGVVRGSQLACKKQTLCDPQGQDRGGAEARRV